MLTRICLGGFKTFSQPVELDLCSLNVLIGANGAGKSNLISFFRLLNFLSTGALQEWIGRAGGASSLLSYGSEETQQIRASLRFESSEGTNSYDIRLSWAAPDTLIFVEERVGFHRKGKGYVKPQEIHLGAGHKESSLIGSELPPAKFVLSQLHRCKVYQFHDTSGMARVRKPSYLEDNQYLRDNAGNLAAVLFRLGQKETGYYQRIVGVVRQIFPRFHDFDLAPSALNERTVLLNWTESGSPYLFGPHQLSDGTLRAIALITLLLLPDSMLPDLILLDEPELGLHPYALTILAGLVQAVTTRRQVLISTQSATLIDHFKPEDIVTVDRTGRDSALRRQEPDRLREWLADYSISELWEKNVLGGRPA